MNGEVIPHSEKVFSIFEEHTEWVCKGKAGVPVELGVRVSILEDQYQFILHHRIMWKETDDKVMVPIIEEAKQRYPLISQCSFDKGYYSIGGLALPEIVACFMSFGLALFSLVPQKRSR